MSPHEDALPRRAPREYGPYQLLEKVAVGGMAEVWKATQSGIGGFVKVADAMLAQGLI